MFMSCVFFFLFLLVIVLKLSYFYKIIYIYKLQTIGDIPCSNNIFKTTLINYIFRKNYFLNINLSLNLNYYNYISSNLSKTLIYNKFLLNYT